MKSLIISCRTLENELTSAMKTCQISWPVIWLDASLHNVKDKLRAAVQEVLDIHTEEDRIFLATSFCGNALEGLQNRQAELIIPRTDDCISTLLGGTACKMCHMDSYFLTEGWLKGERSLMNEYKISLQRYGEKRTGRIFHAMLKNYRSFSLLDTGCYDLEAAAKEARVLAAVFGKSLQTLPASTGYLQELLTGPWPADRFLTLPPGQTLRAASMQLYNNQLPSKEEI